MSLSPKNLPSSIKGFPLFGILLVYVFVSSGICISFLCLLCVLTIWPFNKTLYRRVVRKLAYSFLGQFVWGCIDWADTDITLFGDDDAFDKFGKKSCLVSLSHRGEFDWVIGLIVAAGYGFLETIRSLPKKSVRYVPGFGQLFWALEFPFLNRNWQQDAPNISKCLQTFTNYPFPIQVCIFCEGSRFSKDKFEDGVEYAKRVGLQPLRHHLVPRTKGYAVLAQSLKEAKFEVAYDIGFAYPPGQEYANGRDMSFKDILYGRSIKAFLYMRKFQMQDLPSSIEDLQRFCHKLYVHKDDAYDHFVKHGLYPAKSRPLKFTDNHILYLRVNQALWTTIVLLIPALVFVWYASVSNIITGVAIFLATGMLLMQGLLMFARQKQS